MPCSSGGHLFQVANLSTPASPAAALFSLVFVCLPMQMAAVTPFNLVQRLHRSCDDSKLGPLLSAHSHCYSCLCSDHRSSVWLHSYRSLLLPDYQGKGSHPFLSSVQFSYSAVSDSLQPDGLQHTRLPCPSPNPRPCLNS